MPLLGEKRRHILTLVGLALLHTACQSESQHTQQDGTATELREVKVVTSGGFAAAYDILAPGFEAETGIALTTEYGSSSGGAADSIPVRLQRGEDFDVVILSQSSLKNLSNLGYVRAGTRKDLVRSSIGMAVREGAVVPDISSAERFQAVLLEAESIGYSASASGTYLSTVLFPRLGIWEALEPKSRRILSERVASVVARGEVEIGFQQISEILPIEGAHFVGPIPAEYQKVTIFSTGITSGATNADDAQRLIDYLSSTEVAETVASTGLEPIVTPVVTE